MANTTQKKSGETVTPERDWKGEAAAIRTRRESVVTEDGMVMHDAAVLMGAALKAGKIGKSESAVWQTQGAYATSVGYTSTSQITLLPRLAYALDLGIKRDSPQWTFLTRFGDNGRVGAAFKATREKDGTPAKKRQHLTSQLAPLLAEVKKDGRLTSAKGKATGASRTADEKKAAKPAPVKVKATPEDILHALHALRVPTHDLSDADWTKVKAGMLKQVSAEDNRRAMLNQKAAKAAKAEGEKIPA